MHVCTHQSQHPSTSSRTRDSQSHLASVCRVAVESTSILLPLGLRSSQFSSSRLVGGRWPQPPVRILEGCLSRHPHQPRRPSPNRLSEGLSHKSQNRHVPSSLQIGGKTASDIHHRCAHIGPCFGFDLRVFYYNVNYVPGRGYGSTGVV